MKKWFAALLLIALTLTFVACAKSENTTGANDNNASDNDDVPKTYTVSGAWKFSEVLTFPLIEAGDFWDVTEMLTFTSNGKVYDRFINVHAWGYDDNLTCFVLDYSSLSSPTADRAYASLDTPAKWTEEAYRTVDFGDVPQEVSKTFYEWFTENAKQISE